MAIDDDGQGIYSTRLGHGDAQHTGDLDPGRPGLETWSIHENERPTADFIGSEMRDTKTGEVLWIGVQGRDVARGMAADIDPRYPGSEVWGGSRTLYASNGTPIGPAPRCTNMAIWWDGDLQRELLSGVRIIKWDFASTRETVLLEGRSLGLRSNNGSKDNPCLVVDLLGDWREELIARTRDNREIRIYVSTIPTAYRQLPLLMDRAYRNSIAWQNVGYNQPAHPSFDLQSTLDQAPVFLSNVVIGKLMQDAKQPPEALTESELKSAILKESELGNFTLPGTFQSASILPLRTHFYDTLPGKEMIFQCKTVFLKPDGSTVERWVLVKKKFPDDMQRDSELPN